MYRKTGFIKRNRAFLLLFANVAAIVLLYNLGIRFLVPDRSVKKTDGYELKLKAFLFENEVLVTLRIGKIGELTAEGEASVVFTAGASTDADSSSEAHAMVLPQTAGEESAFHVRLPVPDTGDTVVASVLLAGERFDLSAVIEGK